MIRLVCPVDPTHGPVHPVPTGWLCPHVAHDGRLRSHPLGEAPRTRNRFTTAEVEAGGLTARPSMQSDLAGDQDTPRREGEAASPGEPPAPSAAGVTSGARVPTGASRPAADRRSPGNAAGPHPSLGL